MRVRAGGAWSQIIVISRRLKPAARVGVRFVSLMKRSTGLVWAVQRELRPADETRNLKVEGVSASGVALYPRVERILTQPWALLDSLFGYVVRPQCPGVILQDVRLVEPGHEPTAVPE